MKVGLISNTSWSVYNFRKSLIKKLVEEGHHVVVMAPDEGHYKKKIMDWNCEFLPLNQVSPKSINPFVNIRFYAELKKHFTQQNFEVIFSFTPKPNIWGAIAAKHLPVRFIPTINGLGHAFITKGWMSFIVAKLYKSAFRNIERVIFQNPDDVSFFIDKGIVSKHQTLRAPGSGVDLDQFYVAPNNLRQNEVINFLYAGRLIKEKGITEYVKAAAIIRTKYPGATFFMKGGLSDNPSSITKKEIKELVTDKVVKYQEHTDNMSTFLDDIDVVVLPTYYREGIPKILIEAGAKGLPIISTNSIGCNQIIVDNYNGFVVKEKSVDDLVECMERMIQCGIQARRKMGMNGRRLVEEKFSDSVVIKTYLSLIEEKDKQLVFSRAKTTTV